MIYDIYAVGNTLRSIRNKYGYTQNDMAESLDVSYIHYSQIEQGRHRMSLELMLKIVTKYGVDPNTLFGIESREKRENKEMSVLEDKLQMLKPNDREYAMSTCLIFIEGLEARKEARPQNRTRRIHPECRFCIPLSGTLRTMPRKRQNQGRRSRNALPPSRLFRSSLRC